MGKIYQKCWDSLTPGGSLFLIIKDFYEGKLEKLGYRHIQMLHKTGFVDLEWYQWEAPGTFFKAIHKSQGHRVIEGEHIIIMRKPNA